MKFQLVLEKDGTPIKVYKIGGDIDNDEYDLKRDDDWIELMRQVKCDINKLEK